MAAEEIARPQGPSFPWWVWALFAVLFASFALEMAKGPVSGLVAGSGPYKAYIADVEGRTSWERCDLSTSDKGADFSYLLYRVHVALTVTCDPPDDGIPCTGTAEACAEARRAIPRKATVSRPEIRLSAFGFGDLLDLFR